MRGILLATVALVALSSTSAFAGSHNFAAIGQLGFAQKATIDETHANYSSAVIGQAGGFQKASIEQGHHYNTVWGDNAAIVQVGGAQYAKVNQQGNGDNAAIVQLGAFQGATISQGGSHDTAVIVQAGVGQSASIKQ